MNGKNVKAYFRPTEWYGKNATLVRFVSDSQTCLIKAPISSVLPLMKKYNPKNWEEFKKIVEQELTEKK